jgi:hypothetical protein
VTRQGSRSAAAFFVPPAGIARDFLTAAYASID